MYQPVNHAPYHLLDIGTDRAGREATFVEVAMYREGGSLWVDRDGEPSEQRLCTIEIDDLGPTVHEIAPSEIPAS